MKSEKHIFVNKKQEKIINKLLYWLFVNTPLQVGFFMNPKIFKFFILITIFSFKSN